VIATPTPTHAAVCREIAGLLPAASILVEKPAASQLADAEHVLRDMGSRQPVDVAYHMAFAPEVAWGVQATTAAEDMIGRPVSAQAFFADAYEDHESAAARLGNSWIDSGINALSVLRRFIQPAARVSLRYIGQENPAAFEARITCRAGNDEPEALIMTTWNVTDPAKTTRIRYSSGAELVMDHTAVAAYLIINGQITGMFSADASIPRRERHYRALYQSWLVEGQPNASQRDHVLLHELLLNPADA
jgi:predicted dehydrogenase